MTTSTLAIPVAFGLLAAILLWVLIGSKGKWWLKAALSAVTLYFVLAVWSSITSYLGYASNEEMPWKYSINHAMVLEPDKKTGEPGKVLLWVTKIEDEPKGEEWHDKVEDAMSDFTTTLAYKPSDNAPRVHEIEYSRELHKQVQQMLQGMKQGKKYVGGKGFGKGFGEPGDGKGKGDGDGKGKGRGQGEGKQGGQPNGGMTPNADEYPWFHELPPPKYPAKPTE